MMEITQSHHGRDPHDGVPTTDVSLTNSHVENVLVRELDDVVAMTVQTDNGTEQLTFKRTERFYEGLLPIEDSEYQSRRGISDDLQDVLHHIGFAVVTDCEPSQ